MTQKININVIIQSCKLARANAAGVRRFAKQSIALLVAGLFIAGSASSLNPSSASAQAAPSVCSGSTAPATTYGQVTQTVSVPTAGTYRVWSRMKIPDSASNSYYFQVDGDATCGIGNSTTMPVNTWVWVNYRGGDTASTTYKTLSAGNHTLRYTGYKPGVQLDRVLLLGDANCVPTGTGDNCANVDATGPTVSITAPTNGATVSGKTQAVTATAADASGVAKVEFLVDGALKTPADTATPYTYTWDTTTVSNGSHTLTAKATDTVGNTTTSSAVTVNVNNVTTDTTAPTVSLAASPTSVTVGAPITLTGTASDNVAVTKVEFYDGATLITSDTAAPYSYAWSTTGKQTGAHSLTAKAYDAAGNTKTSTAVSVQINAGTPTGDTTLPTVTMTAPANGVSAVVGSTVVVSATATDNVGVTKVEFYDGTKLLNANPATPYAYSWNTTGATAGAHSLTAKAYDAAGNTKTSAVISITLTAGGSTPTPGDVNGDGRVNAIDLSALITHDGQNYPAADFNKDGTVGAADMAILLSKWTW